MTQIEFSSSNRMFVSVLKTIKEQGGDETTSWPSKHRVQKPSTSVPEGLKKTNCLLLWSKKLRCQYNELERNNSNYSSNV